MPFRWSRRCSGQADTVRIRHPPRQSKQASSEFRIAPSLGLPRVEGRAEPAFQAQLTAYLHFGVKVINLLLLLAGGAGALALEEW